MEIKITKQLLQDYKKMKCEIVLLNSEIKEMQKSNNVVGSSPLLEKRTKALEEKIQQVAAVEEWIEKIEDDQTRSVFKMFYLKNYSWTKITEYIGCAGSKDYARLHIRDNFLKKSGIK